MSTVLENLAPTEVELQPLEIDQTRGTQGMWLFIGSETFLFTMLFFAYFFLSFGDWRWLREEPPKLHYALPMLGILILSSIVLRWGEKQVERERFGAGRAALGGTIFLGLVFLVLSAFDYKEHLVHLTPQTNAYGSIFYTITTFHVAHLILGLSMLCFVLVLPRVGRTNRPPHHAYSDAAMYWHFVDIIWVLVVGCLYVLPNIR